MNTFELDSKNKWIKNVRRVRSPNCDERPKNSVINLVVIHGISLPPRQFGGNHIDNLFTNSLNPDEHTYFSDIQHLRVSAHLLINRNGLVTQYVPFNKRAWHAGESMFDGCTECNDFSIGIEMEGSDEDQYEKVQYDTLSVITKMIMKSWPDVTHERITGHSDISPGRKTDPGPKFNWNNFYKSLD
ncbi:MAG: AmpD protein [Gammaproteobacteria bacterium]|jgi:AmpD protein